MTPTNHDSSKVLLGSSGSSHKEVTCEPGDPAVAKAGLAVSKDSNGEIAVGGAAGSFLGVSMGRSLSDTEKCAIARNGLRVPMKLKDDNVFSSLVKGDLTFTSKLRGTEGDNISIEFVDGGTAGEEVVTVTDQLISISGDDGVSTAQEIADALEASEDAMALIGVEIAGGEEATAQAAFAEDNLESGVDAFAWVVVGAAVEVDGTTGEATESDEATGGVYASGVLNAIDPFTGQQDGYAAYVDMVGGL